MPQIKLIRITTVPLSLDKLLEGQLQYMQQHIEVVAVSSGGEELEAVEKREGVRTIAISMTRQITPLKDIISVWKLYHLFKKECPAIVHTHTPKAGIVGMTAAWLAKVPIRLHTVAGLPLMEAKGLKRKLLNFVEKTTYRFATKVYPNSKGLYNFIKSENFTSPKKLKIIGNGSSNGINTNYFNPSLFPEEEKTALREKLNIPANAFVFVFVGRLVGDKGINELVRAFKSLSLGKDHEIASSPPSDAPRKDEPKIYLLLVGPEEADLDPLKPETQKEIAQNANIITVGYQNDVRPYFAISDALVFPSYREGFPNVVLQAAAMGLPAIVSDINGCNEIIIPNESGIIIPPKNTEALTDAMNLLVNDAHLYQHLKSNARAQITSRFERQQVWDALLEEYQTLLGEKE